MLGIAKLNTIGKPRGPGPVLSGLVGYVSTNANTLSYPTGSKAGDWMLVNSSAGYNSSGQGYWDADNRGTEYVFANTTYTMGSAAWTHSSVWIKITQPDLDRGPIKLWANNPNTVATVITAHRWQNYPNLQEFYGSYYAFNDFDYLSSTNLGRNLIFKYDFYNDEAPSGPDPSHDFHDPMNIIHVRLWESYGSETFNGVRPNYSNQSNYNCIFGYTRMKT
jgi:hypothetical protein